MTYMPRSLVTTLTDDPTSVAVARSSTRYMQGFQLLQPALGGTDIRTYANVRGNLDIYTVGTNETVFRLRRGEGDAAPYAMTNLGINGRQIFAYTNDGARSNTPNLMTLGSNGQLKLATFQSATGTYYQRETKPASATETIRQFRGVRGLTGNIYFNVILEDGSGRPGILGNNFYRPGTDDWAGPDWVAVKDEAGAEVRAKAIAMADNNPVQTALFAVGEDDDLLFSETSDRAARMRKLGPRKLSHLSVVTDAADRLNIFAIEKDTGALMLKRQRRYSTGSGLQFEDWVVLDAGQEVPLTSLFAAQTFAGLLQVFGVGSDGALHWTGQMPGNGRGTEPEWQPLFNLGNEIASDPAGEAAIFTVGRTEAGYAEAYTVSRAGALTRFWQSPTTGQWFDEPVELPRDDDDMVPVETHSLELTVLNDKGLPAPQAEVSIRAASLVTLYVNGLSYRVSQVDAVTLRAGPDGRIAIQQRANALAAVALYVETPYTLAGDTLVIQPNLQLQEKLAGLSVADIRDAKAGDTYLLPPEFRDDAHAESIQQITRASMEIAATDENGSGKVAYHTRSRARARGAFRPHLNLARIEGTAWEIDFSSGFPVFSDTTTEAVAAWQDERMEAMRSAGHLGAAGGFLGIDWGNVWNAIKSGAEWIVDGISKIVVSIVDGVGRVLFEIAGKVFEAVIEFAQQAFDFVQGIWNWLKVKLEQLYEWLAFLFNLEDVVRTAEALKHSMLVTLDFTIDGVDAVKNMILTGIDSLKDDIGRVVDSFVDELDKQGNPSFGTVAEENRVPDEAQNELEHNPFSNAFIENSDRATEKGSSAVTATVTEPGGTIDGLIAKLSALADNFQFGDGKEVFDEGLNYFTAIGDDPSNAVNLLLSGTAKIMESIAYFALDFAKGVIATILDLIAEIIKAFRDLLFEEWEIPVFSQLYRFFTGKTLGLTPINIAAYVMAAPATLIYKLTFETAPFPDDAALERFKNAFTVDWLKSQVGIATQRTAVVLDAALEKWLKGIALGFYAAGMAVRIVVDAATATVSALGTGLKPLSYTSVILRYITTVSTMPWLVSPGVGAPSCPAGSKGFSAVIWLSQLVFGPTRGLFLTCVMKPGKAKIYTSEVSLSVWGAVNAIMQVWNFVDLPSAKRDAVAFSRTLTNIVGGQLDRFLFTPDIQKAYAIPYLVGLVLQTLCYGASIGLAIAEMAML